MWNEIRGRLLAMVIMFATIGAVPMLLLAITGFDVRRLEWWVWSFDVLRTRGHPPLTESAVVIATILVGTAAAAYAAASLSPQTYGRAQWARWRDISPLTKRLGLHLSRRPSPGIVLGIWGRRVLTMSKPFSAMVFGPTRGGKSAGVYVPTIVNLPNRSLVVNDPSGDLYERTHMTRRKLGRVVRLCWDAVSQDAFNALSRDSIPPDAGARGDLVDRHASVIVQEQDFWGESGRDTLSTAALYCFYAAEAKGRDTSYGEVLTWLSSLRVLSDDPDGDPARDALEAAATEAQSMGWPPRIHEGLMRLASNDSKTRSNIMATVFASLRVFANDYVREATNRSSFKLSELRGDGGKPLTVYLCVRPTSQRAYGPITALFLECALSALAQRLPQKEDLGCSFLLDELYFVPRVQGIAEGPAIYSKYDVAFLLGFQDRAQIEERYGKELLKAFDTNTAVKIVLQLNEPETAKWVETLIGPMTGKRRSQSTQTGAGKVGDGSVTSGLEGRPLVLAQDALSLPFGRQIVIIQGRPHRPIPARSALYYELPYFRKLVQEIADAPRA